MRVISKVLTNDEKRAEKYFLKKKDGLLKLRMSLDYELLRRLYGKCTVSERINAILSSKEELDIDRDELENISCILSDEDLSDKKKIKLILEAVDRL